MIRTIETTKEIFKKKSLNVTALSVGSSGPGVCKSVYNKTAMGMPRISAIGIGADLFLSNDAHPIGDAKTGEVFVVSKDNICRFIPADNIVKFQKEADLDLLWSAILASVCLNDTDEELTAVMQKMANDYKAEGYVAEEDMYLFCDNLYQRNSPRLLQFLTCEENVMTLEVEAKRGAENEIFGPVKLFADTGFATVPEFAKAKKKTAKAKKGFSKDIHEDARNGKYIIPYPWDPKFESMIDDVSLLDRYVTNPEFESMLVNLHAEMESIIDRVNSIKPGDGNLREKIESMTPAERRAAIGDMPMNLKIVGRPGTGKTFSVQSVGASLGFPVGTSNMSKNTEEDFAQGISVMIDGKVTMVPTEFMEIYEHGGIIVLEEINLTDAGVLMGALGQALISPYCIMRYGYERVTRHPLCIIVATMNAETIGTVEQNQALMSRFHEPYILNDVPDDLFVQILMSKGFSENNSKWVANCYNEAVDWLNSRQEKEIAWSLTIRQCLMTLKAIETFGENPKEALKRHFVGAFMERDEELAKKLWDDKLSVIPYIA